MSPSRCWQCGKGAQWVPGTAMSASGRAYGFCKKCQTATPVQQIPMDAHKVDDLERLNSFTSRLARVGSQVG